MNIIKYYFERSYPYIISFILVIFLGISRIKIWRSCNFNNALDGVLTMTSLIIGFLGAILPVILGMKNESKFVKYVFEKDENKLFLKYIKITILIGLTIVCVTIFLYFKDQIKHSIIKQYLVYIWAFLIISFILCTYRSLKNMLNLIFSNDEDLKHPLYKNIKEDISEDERLLQKKYKFTGK